MFARIKRIALSSALFAITAFAYLGGSLAINTIIAQDADAAECSYYETLHPNFPLTGSHLSTGKCSSCASCHAGGIYLGTPKVCATCHNGNPLGQISSATIGHTAQHIPVGVVNCDACHNTTSPKIFWLDWCVR